jgi:hypothetical protein
MAKTYFMYIVNKDPRIEKPKPKFVRVILTHNCIMANEWKIPGSHANNWIGNGSGTYQYDSTKKKLIFYREDDEWVRTEFFSIN